jgi:putative peptidoglycan lipid II flippase
MVTNHLNIVSIPISFKWDSKLINFLKTSSFLILGMSVLVVIPIINKAMASYLGPGSVSLLEYADRLYVIPITLITSGFAVTTLSHWSEMYEIEGVQQLKKNVYQGVTFVAIIGVGLSVLLSLISSYLVNFVYGHGQIPVDKIREIENVFRLYLLSITPYFIAMMFERALLAMKNTKLFFYSALVRIAGTVIFNWILIQRLGLPGIALAATGVMILASLFLWLQFNRNISIRGG